MRKQFKIGNKFLQDTKIERLFIKLVIPEFKVRYESHVTYTGRSDMFNHIKGDFAKIGYQAGEFRAFEVNEIQEGWLYLDQENESFDSEITFPDIPNNNNQITNVIKMTSETVSFNQVMNGEIPFTAVMDRESFMDSLTYPQLLALATNESIGMKFDSKKVGGRKSDQIKQYLFNWKAE